MIVFAAAAVVIVATVAWSTSDMTPTEIRESIIVPVVEALGGGEAAVNLIYRTGLAESGYRVVEQTGGGPALGYWQMEPATHDDIWDNFLQYREGLTGTISLFMDETLDVYPSESLTTNHRYACAMCRVHYMRVSARLPAPEDIEGQADYWKAHYNTPTGRGTVQHFIDAVEFNG